MKFPLHRVIVVVLAVLLGSTSLLAPVSATPHTSSEMVQQTKQERKQAAQAAKARANTEKAWKKCLAEDQCVQFQIGPGISPEWCLASVFMQVPDPGLTAVHYAAQLHNDPGAPAFGDINPGSQEWLPGHPDLLAAWSSGVRKGNTVAVRFLVAHHGDSEWMAERTYMATC